MIKTHATVEDFVRDLLPIYDLEVACQFCREDRERPMGFREDVVTAMQRAIEAKVEKYPRLQQLGFLPKLESVSETVRKASGCDNARQLLLATAYRNMKMAETGWIADPQSQEVLCAMLFANEAEEEDKHNDGEKNWPSMREAKIAADRMITALRYQGLYAVLLH